MGKYSIIVGLLMFLQTSAVYAGKCLIEGTWQSNEEKTLESMKSSNLSKEQRKILENGFFGKLVIVSTCKGFYTVFDGEKENYKYKSIKVEDSKAIVTYYDQLINEYITKSISIKNGCYSMPLERLGFSEVFCRVNNVHNKAN